MTVETYLAEDITTDHGETMERIPWTDFTASRIMVVDDDDIFRTVLATALRKEGYRVIEARNGAEVVEDKPSGTKGLEFAMAPDLVVLDHRLPGVTGLELLEAMQLAVLSTPVFFVTGYADSELRKLAHRYGAVTVEDKDKPISELIDKIRRYYPRVGKHRLRWPTLRLIGTDQP